MLDGHQHVLLEFGIVAMTLGVLEHQRELRHDVFQVMDDEGRHAVESIELAHFEQSFGRLHLTEESASLAAGSLEQIVDLPINVQFGARRRQNDEADQVISGCQRHHQPGVGHLDQPGRQEKAVVTARQRAILLKIDHPATVEQELAEGAIRLLGRRRNRHIPVARLGEESAARVFQPKRTGGALDHIGEPLNHMLAHLGIAGLRGQGARETQPFLAIVVAVAEKMLADENAKLCLHRPREAEHAKPEQGGEKQCQLEGPPPIATEITHVVAGSSHEQQIDANGNERHRLQGGAL